MKGWRATVRRCPGALLMLTIPGPAGGDTNEPLAFIAFGSRARPISVR